MLAVAKPRTVSPYGFLQIWVAELPTDLDGQLGYTA